MNVWLPAMSKISPGGMFASRTACEMSIRPLVLCLLVSPQARDTSPEQSMPSAQARSLAVPVLPHWLPAAPCGGRRCGHGIPGAVGRVGQDRRQRAAEGELHDLGAVGPEHQREDVTGPR